MDTIVGFLLALMKLLTKDSVVLLIALVILVVRSSFTIYEELNFIKKTKYKVIMLFICLLSVPLVLLAAGLFQDKSILHNSDILGYYGAIIGSIVTIFCIQATFKYENENLKEERRKDSLPILRFKFTPTAIDVVSGFTDTSTEYSNRQAFNDYDITFDISDKNNEKRTIEYGELTIENIGLGVAVFSQVRFGQYKKHSGGFTSEVERLSWRQLDKYVVRPGGKTKLTMYIKYTNISNDDKLIFHFMDLYSNKYYYEIPFNKVNNDSGLKTKIEPSNVEVIPKLTVDNTFVYSHKGRDVILGE